MLTPTTATPLLMWSSRPSSLPTGFIPPCLPTRAPCAPTGADWLHEIKHDGIRVIARKEDKRVKLYSRPGNDLAHRFPQIVEALWRLRSQTYSINSSASRDEGEICAGDEAMARSRTRA
jgi:ATP-dependent DNA ligase